LHHSIYINNQMMTFDQERTQIFNQYRALIDGKNHSRTDFIFDLFHFQYKYNVIFQEYVRNLGINVKDVSSTDKIPFLPISAFKHHEVKTGNFDTEDLFLSSGTTSTVVRSKHFVRDLSHYLQNTVYIWSTYFQNISEYCVLALLPGYLEREGSSLISMVQHFVQLSKYDESGFYLRDHKALYDKLLHNKRHQIPTVLFGVTYALLDFVAAFEMDFPELIVMETGGMKGQRKEMTKAELHEVLKPGFGVRHIYSEYGMTELFSQAYATESILFKPNPFIEIIIHQVNDPLTSEKIGKPGIISVIDLANIDSCAFIQTEDMGILYEDQQFEIIGRLNAADMRGCNLMVQEM
jgi:Acyl-protein synthetase, LuxE